MYATTASTGSTSSDDCSCPSGYETSLTNSNECQECKIGYFKTYFGSHGCNSCEPTRTTLSTGPIVEANDCLCKPGFEQISSECESCEIGYFKNEISNGKCTQCPTGSTTSINGETDESDCSICLPGYGFNFEKGECRVCGAGSYSGVSSNSICETCPVGATTDSDTATSYDECYCIDGSEFISGECGCKGAWQGDECDICPENFIQDGDNCQECAYGWEGNNCDLCPENYYEFSSGIKCSICSYGWTGDNCNQCNLDVYEDNGKCDTCIESNRDVWNQCQQPSSTTETMVQVGVVVGIVGIVALLILCCIGIGIGTIVVVFCCIKKNSIEKEIIEQSGDIVLVPTQSQETELQKL